MYYTDPRGRPAPAPQQPAPPQPIQPYTGGGAQMPPAPGPVYTGGGAQMPPAPSQGPSAFAPTVRTAGNSGRVPPGIQRQQSARNIAMQNWLGVQQQHQQAYKNKIAGYGVPRSTRPVWGQVGRTGPLPVPAPVTTAPDRPQANQLSYRNWLQG